MKATIRQFRNLEWSIVPITTNPLHASFEDQPAGQEFKTAEEWSMMLPTALIDGKPTRLHEDPEGWLTKMSKMPYTRLSVNIESE